MFQDMKTRVRNPFKHNLNWECDDVKYGQCDWISIEKLDTLAEKRTGKEKLTFLSRIGLIIMIQAKYQILLLRRFIFQGYQVLLKLIIKTIGLK